MNKSEKFHRDVFFPEWTESRLNTFCEKLSQIRLINSYHTNKKISKLSRSLKRVISQIISGLDFTNNYYENMFEFVSRGGEIKKVCYRFPVPNMSLDIILVISASGRVVTVYINKDSDNHKSLDRSNYCNGDENGN